MIDKDSTKTKKLDLYKPTPLAEIVKRLDEFYRQINRTKPKDDGKKEGKR